MPARWNAKVGERDEVYIVGDLFFRAATVEPILKALHDASILSLATTTIRGCGASKSETIREDAKQNPLSMFCLEA